MRQIHIGLIGRQPSNVASLQRRTISVNEFVELHVRWLSPGTSIRANTIGVAVRSTYLGMHRQNVSVSEPLTPAWPANVPIGRIYRVKVLPLVQSTLTSSAGPKTRRKLEFISCSFCSSQLADCDHQKPPFKFDRTHTKIQVWYRRKP